MNMSNLGPIDPKVRISRMAGLMPGAGARVQRAMEIFIRDGWGRFNNTLYWQKFGLKFEQGKLELDEHHLDRHLRMFLNLCGKSGPVLEAGCGIGRSARMLLDAGLMNYTGLDVCEDVIKAAIIKPNGFEFIHADIREFYITPLGKYQGAIMTDILPYLSPVDQIKALNNINRGLALDSHLLIRWVKGGDNFDITEKTVNGGSITGHVFRASKQYIKELLTARGFELMGGIEQPVISEKLLINKGTRFEREEEYSVVFAKKVKSV